METKTIRRKSEIRHLWVGSFNINASKLTTFDARKWLEDVTDFQPDVVAIGFQECADFPAENSPSPVNFQREYSKTWSGQNMLQTEINNSGANDENFQSTLTKVLKGYNLVTDVAIGERPQQVIVSGKKTSWYGAIRLLVYFKAAFDPDPEVTTLIIPTGSKKSAVPDWSGYSRDSSPDKGAVAAHFPEYDLLLVNCHLNGTNKYGVCESKFDEKRVNQLERIYDTLLEKVPDLTGTRVVTFGDLNFRLQKQNDPHAKERGGLDFQMVNELAESQDHEKLISLFNECDRLHLLLSGSRAKKSVGPIAKTPPRLLQKSHDALALMLQRGDIGNALPLTPSFTKISGEAHPRPFNDKRTPSWTDRIMWEGEADELICFKIFGEITISDHDPCSALFEFNSSFSKDAASWSMWKLIRNLCVCVHLVLVVLALIGVVSSFFFSTLISVMFL